MKTSPAPRGATHPSARDRELHHLELRGFLSPWTRDLKTGNVTRHTPTGRSVYRLSALEVRSALGDAKAWADERLEKLGFLLLDVPGGCELEK